VHCLYDKQPLFNLLLIQIWEEYSPASWTRNRPFLTREEMVRLLDKPRLLGNCNECMFIFVIPYLIVHALAPKKQLCIEQVCCCRDRIGLRFFFRNIVQIQILIYVWALTLWTHVHTPYFYEHIWMTEPAWFWDSWSRSSKSSRYRWDVTSNWKNN
jgi:hypothetical protein